MIRTSSHQVVRRVGWVPIAFLIAAVLVVSVAGITWNTSPKYGRPDPVAAAPSPVAAAPTATGTYSIQVAPDRVVIPKLKATAPVVKVATGDDGELEVPQNPKTVGWWSPGARPGARTGTAVLAGHINYAGVDGTFSRIGKLAVGDTVEVYGKYDAGTRKVSFRVTGVRTYHKTHLPYRQIFDQKIAGRLALITCGGPFDASTGNYLDNIVVYAVPVSPASA